MSTDVIGRKMVIRVEYVRINYTELISVYMKAYRDAGFEFIDKRAFKDGSIELEFSFSIPEYKSKGKEGRVIFSFGAELLDNKICAPCSVHRMVYGLRWDADYAAEEAVLIKARMDAADRIAAAYVRQKLGKSLPDL